MCERIGGITVGNGWMRNNPKLVYPDGHEVMSDKELRKHLMSSNIKKSKRLRVKKDSAK